MRFHQNQIEPIRQTLVKIFFDQVKDHMAVAFMLENNKKWGSNDRKTASKCVYDIVRYWRRYWYCIDQMPDTAIENYQKIVAVWLSFQEGHSAKVNDIDDDQLRLWVDKFNSIEDLAIKESVAQELHDLAQQELGEARWIIELPALNKEASFILRVNTSKAKIDRVAESLAQEGIETTKIEQVPSALIVVKRVNLQKSPTYTQGVFEIQDASSQMVVPFLDIQNDTIVIDACAGAGGKTMQIADVLRNTGRVIAMDIEQNKLQELKRRAERNRFTKIDTFLIQNEKSLQMYYEKADRLLLDVPCTGIGVLRRNADDKYKITRESLQAVLKKQEAILQIYPNMLKKGGIMVYSTCSIFPSENEKQVQHFLKTNPNFFLLEEKTIYPSVSGFDGFYMAKIQRNK